MMALTRKCQYALRALYRLTREYLRGPVMVWRMAEEERIPERFLGTILLQLKSHGLVASRKGRGGGYYLAVPPEAIRIGAVIRIIDGPVMPVPCATERPAQPCSHCSDAMECVTRLLMLEVRTAVEHILNDTTLASLCRKTGGQSTFAPAAFFE